MDQERRPENLLGVVLDAYWTSLASDPLSTLRPASWERRR